MPLHVLAHVDADDVVLGVEERLRQRLGEFRLADAGGAEEEEGTDRAARVLDPRTGADHRVGHEPDGFVLADHAPVQDLVQAQQLLALALDQAGDRDAGPLGDDLRDLVVGHLFPQQPARGVGRAFRLLLALELRRQVGEDAVPQLGGAVQVVVAFGDLDLAPHLFDLLAHLPLVVDRRLLALPLAAHRRVAGPQVGEFTSERLQARLARLVGLLGQRRLLDLEPHHAAGHFVEFSGQGVDLGADQGAGLVDEVDRLVGQEPVGDVAVGEGGRGDQGVVLDPHAVVNLEALAQAAQDGHRVLDRRRVDEDRLESPLEGRVLLDVLAVLVQGGRADAMEFAPREHRLEQVAGVGGALRAAGADDVVNLVDEQENAALAPGDLG